MKKSPMKKKSAGEKVCSGLELARALSKTRLPKDEAKAWRRDLQAARIALMRPVC